MGYIFDFRDARDYERWLSNPKNHPSMQLQTQLILDLLDPMPGDTILDIGCGTGYYPSAFLDRKLHVSGIDPSPYMLDIAAKTLAGRADLHRGVAEDLPFEDNTFNYASLITTLEFVDFPEKALQEAFRVAKDRVVLGVLNRYALQGIQRRIIGIFIQSIYNRARFFSVWEIKRMAFELLGKVPVSWRTVCQFPTLKNRLASRMESLGVVQRCPFGAFAAVSITLTPRIMTRPLPLEYSAKHTASSLMT